MGWQTLQQKQDSIHTVCYTQNDSSEIKSAEVWNVTLQARHPKKK